MDADSVSFVEFIQCLERVSDSGVLSLWQKQQEQKMRRKSNGRRSIRGRTGQIMRIKPIE